MLWAARVPLRAADDPRAAEFGFEQRVRNENWNNIFDYSDRTDDQRNQIRYRTRLWTNLPLTPKITLAAGLNQETCQVIVPRQPYRFDEVIFETAYLDIRDLFLKGLSLRVGRQNLIRGEGALIFEGTAWDGSRTIYSNAAVLSYARQNVKVDWIGVLNPARERFLPRIHDRRRMLTEWTDQALGTYVTWKLNRNADVESYYFYKKEVNDTRARSNPQFQPDRHVSTAGGRLVQRLANGWTATSEAAGQWGATHAHEDIRAWYAFSHVKKEAAAKTKPYLLGGYWGFSGDNPRTPGRIEGWDPLFARWPKWSELYIYSQVKEKGAAYWTNTSLWQAEMGFQPWKPVRWRFTYYRMGAYHPFAGDPKIFAGGTSRGNMWQTRLDFTVDKHWNGHVLYEALAPGDFYRVGSLTYFLRFELIYTIKGHFKL